MTHMNPNDIDKEVLEAQSRSAIFYRKLERRRHRCQQIWSTCLGSIRMSPITLLGSREGYQKLDSEHLS